MPRRLLIAILLSACTTGAQSTGIENVTCPTDSTLTYANFGQALIASNCLSCHRSGRPQLSTQAGIQANTGGIIELTVYTDAMPKSGDLTTAQRMQLGEWLACGAP
jgi:hypothetical protein